MTTPICRFVVVGFGMLVFGVFIGFLVFSLIGRGTWVGGAGLVFLELSGLILVSLLDI
jgi:hypothetical protein